MTKNQDPEHTEDMTEMAEDASWEGMPASFPVCQEHKDQYFKDNDEIKVMDKEFCWICQQELEEQRKE